MLSAMTPPESHVAADHIVKLDCADLIPGMYVCELDRAWLDTPFQIDGFHLKTVEDIQLVLKVCRFVYIDTNRGAKPQKMKRNQLSILSSARKAATVSASVKVERDTYPITHSIKQQLGKARKAYDRLKLELDAQALAIRERTGKTRSAVVAEGESQNLNIAMLDRQLLHLIDTIVANPQALIWILNTESVASIAKQQANYCVRAAIWASILGRQLGMSMNDMKVLFQGTLLADIGMNLLPQRLVSKRGPFRRKEFLVYIKHVELGLEILSGQTALDTRVAGIVRCHHERHEGLGFPGGVRGKQIPALARIANLAYRYERLLRIHSRQRVSSGKGYEQALQTARIEIFAATGGGVYPGDGYLSGRHRSGARFWRTGLDTGTESGRKTEPKDSDSYRHRSGSLEESMHRRSRETGRHRYGSYYYRRARAESQRGK